MELINKVKAEKRAQLARQQNPDVNQESNDLNQQ